MTAPPGINRPFVLDQRGVSPGDADAALDDALVAEADTGVVEVAGPGAVQCLQGLLTNDVERPGPAGLVYGAVLTPKGMIITDLWAQRDEQRFLVVAPGSGRAPLLDVFKRSLPPRLARFEDRSEHWTVLRVAGPAALDRVQAAGIQLPAPGQTQPAIVGETACIVARPDDDMDPPFALQLLVARDEAAVVRARLETAGVQPAAPAALDLVRILRGWPLVGAEIREKTLPQEVRFEENHGVSYTKGCYTGQETVARVHFRGHPNRHLLGLAWDDAPDLANDELLQGGKAMGTVTSIAWLAPMERYVGLGLVRRAADVEQMVTAAGRPAALHRLPFDIDE